MIKTIHSEVLLFARKRKTEGVVRLEYQGVKLNMTKEVKYLGVILDDKLMWKAQVRMGLRAVWSCNAYIGRTWGLSMALWLYKHVIIPRSHMRLSCGGTVWTLP